MVSRLGEGHMPCTFFLSEPQLKTTVTGVLTLRFHENLSVLQSVNSTAVPSNLILQSVKGVLMCVFNLYHVIELKSTVSRMLMFNIEVISF